MLAVSILIFKDWEDANEGPKGNTPWALSDDVENPIKCDLCGGDPQCVAVCPKNVIRLIPEQALGEARRISNVLSYTHMKEIEFMEKGQKKTIQYAEIGKEEL